MKRHETDLVTLASSINGYEMHLLRDYLESEGVRAFLRDEHMTTNYGPASSALGGVKLDVMWRDIERARELMREHEASMDAARQRGELTLNPWQDMHLLEEVAPEDEVELVPGVRDVRHSEDACPECGERSCEPAPLSTVQLLIVLLGLGVPLWFMKSRWRCQSCGHHWQS